MGRMSLSFPLMGLLLVSSAVGLKCEFEKHDGMYIPCAAQSGEPHGPLDQKQKECYEMERCAGVTCEAGNTNSCSLRFNKACDPDNQLKKSDSKETSWLKKCDCSYARKDQMFITCNPEEGKKAPEVETLEEAKITCDMTYGDCKGVSCKLIDGEPKECTAHDAWVCGPGEMGTDQARVAFMKECNEPVSSKCVWREKPDLAINCKSDKEHEKQVFRNVDDAKKACENQLDNKRLDQRCVGVEKIVSANEFRLMFLNHCAEGKEFLKENGDVYSYIHHCKTREECSSPCFDYQEGAGHHCAEDCQCDGARTCQPSGFCGGSPGMCYQGDDCTWGAFPLSYFPMMADESTGSREEMQKKCIALGDKCQGVTCDKLSTPDKACSARSHAAVTDSETEDSYRKCCGPSKKFCTAMSQQGSGSGRSSGSTVAVLVIGLLLLGGVSAALLAQNRRMAGQYLTGKNTFTALPQDDEENYIIEDHEDADEVGHP